MKRSPQLTVIVGVLLPIGGAAFAQHQYPLGILIVALELLFVGLLGRQHRRG